MKKLLAYLLGFVVFARPFLLIFSASRPGRRTPFGESRLYVSLQK